MANTQNGNGQNAKDWLALATDWGFLSNDINAKNYVGNFIYYGVKFGSAHFLHVTLGKFITFNTVLLKEKQD